MHINEYIAQMPAGYLFAEIARRVREYEALNPASPVIRMGIGDVTRPLAPSVARAFADAALAMGTPEGFHGYGPDGGYPFLIELILRHEYQARGVRLDPDEVFISDGAKTDTAAIQELFAPDAVIAVTDPVYPVYVDSNAMAGRLGHYRDGRWQKLVTLPCTHDNDFVPQLPSQRVDALYLCLPNNPTGTVLSREQLQAIVDWARANDTLIVFDAAYKAFISDPQLPRSIYEIEGAGKWPSSVALFQVRGLYRRALRLDGHPQGAEGAQEKRGKGLPQRHVDAPLRQQVQRRLLPAKALPPPIPKKGRPRSRTLLTATGKTPAC